MVKTPPVSKCDVNNCFYNRDLQCHAPAINVGSDHACCDTFIKEDNHIDNMATSIVGACHMAQCRFNSELTCNADGILVGWHADHADCNTFDPRK